MSRLSYRDNQCNEAVINKGVQGMFNEDIVETNILNEDTQPVIRAIGVSHTACKDEFRQNIRSHSWRVFTLFIIEAAIPGRSLISRTTMTWSEAPNLLLSLTSKSAHLNFPVYPNHVETRASVTVCGKYCYKLMPFGVCIARGNLNGSKNVLPHPRVPHLFGRSLRFVRNLGESFEIVKKHVCSVAQAVALTPKPSNSRLVRTCCISRHKTSAEGVAVGKDRTKAIQELSTPTCIKGLCSVLGVLIFVRRFVPNFTEISAPLVDVTRKEFTKRSRFKKAWGKTQDTAFAHIKRLQVSGPALRFPGYGRDFIAHIDDASEM